ncbi:hypothetical protein G7Y89_g1107 [Cudoniella acicularis]|uniref:Tyrosinase copper-binding domain-containing protein n=1 Tax=Cudoniella acicularis TaxID=354080 RepID=A0A8H4RYR9_9HELO|nr:hypothetical protein G7Y89_g1107 [Cudoniella acicularis]
MKSFVLSALAGFACLTSGARADSAADLTALLAQASNNVLAQLQADEAALAKRGIQASCTINNIAIRQEFGSLSPAQRKSYTDAVLCLQNKTALTPTSLVPGVRSRQHIRIRLSSSTTVERSSDGTEITSGNMSKLSATSAATQVTNQFVSLQTSLQIEANYPQYWDWSKWANAPQDSPIFDGSAYSMGDRGEYIPGHPGLTLAPPAGSSNPTIYLPPGYGGGCVQTGPFSNMTVNLGPIGLSTGVPGPDGGFGYNPRCLKRDVGPYPSQKWCNYTRIFELMIDTPTIFDFQNNLEGPPGSGDLGPHGGGHFTIAGDPGADIFTSPGDPAFYLHHGQVDRLWTLWQALDPVNRQYALSGTNTMLNSPPSANTTLEDYINVGYAAGSPIQMKNVMSTVQGPFCYIYI